MNEQSAPIRNSRLYEAVIFASLPVWCAAKRRKCNICVHNTDSRENIANLARNYVLTAQGSNSIAVCCRVPCVDEVLFVRM